MKLNAGKRILMFLHWLCSLLICAALVLLILKPPFAVNLYNKVRAMVTDDQLKIIAIAAIALYAILVIAQLVLIFKRRKRSERGFIEMDSSESGRVRIAISAIEQMVRQSVTHIDGISDMKIKIEGEDDAINIVVNASVVNGGHVPTITMNMQRAIRQFVERNCGVAVRGVPICIRSVTEPRGKRGKKQEVPALVQEPATEAEPVVVPAEEPEPTVVTEPVVEPEPVAEEEPYVEPEPAAEEEPYTEPEPATEEEPYVEPEPAYEEEPYAEPVAEAVPESDDDGADEAPLTDHAFEAAVEAADDAFTEDIYKPVETESEEPFTGSAEE